MDELEVTPEEDGLRADAWLSGRFPEASRNEIRDVLAEGAARVGRRVLKKGHRVAAGERVRLTRAPGPKDFAPAPYEGPEITLVHEHADWLVLGKPAGLPVHPLRADEVGTLANWVAQRFPECVAAGSAPREAGLVHRVDNDTSGLVLVARSAAAHATLRAGWDEVAKGYRALVHGHVLSPQLWAMPIVHRGERNMGALFDERDIRDGSRDAMTEVLRSEPCGRRFSEVWLRIHRGQRHQIRVHAATAGFPLVGDVLYGGAEGLAERHLLHAESLDFTWQGEPVALALAPAWDEVRGTLSARA